MLRRIRRDSMPALAGAVTMLMGWVVSAVTTPLPALALAALLAAAVALLTARARRPPDRTQTRRTVEQHHTHLVESVSHEFLTPLTILRGASELLTERELITSPTGRELADALVRAIDRLDHLTTTVLDVSEAVSHDRRATDDETVDLREVVGDVGVALRRMGGLERLRFEPGPDADTVTTSPELLRMLLLCLGENALRSTPRSQPVDVHTQRDPDAAITLVVRDHAGYRSEPGAPPPPRPQGLHGVGLLSAGRLVARLGGTLTTVRTGDGGLEVTVVLPQRRTRDRALNLPGLVPWRRGPRSRTDDDLTGGWAPPTDDRPTGSGGPLTGGRPTERGAWTARSAPPDAAVPSRGGEVADDPAPAWLPDRPSRQRAGTGSPDHHRPETSSAAQA